MLVGIRKWLLGLVTCGAVGVLSACSTPSLPSYAQTEFGQNGRLPLGDDAIPGFFFSSQQNQVVEYARNASGNTPPLRTLKIRGWFFGADKAGSLYSYYSTALGRACGRDCRVYVSSDIGKVERSFAIPSGGEAFFVDRSGSIYYIAGCTQLIQLASGSTRQLRSINLPKTICGTNPHDFTPQRTVFADSKGGVYLWASRPPVRPTEYIWPPGAHGNASYKYLSGLDAIVGTDAGGNAWGLNWANFTSAVFYGANATGGKATPTVVPLSGMSYVSDMRFASSTNQIVYEGQIGSSGQFSLAIAPSRGGQPVRMLSLPQGFSGFDLVSISF